MDMPFPTADEEQHDWHALPQLIGRAITEDAAPCHCGGYLVRTTDQQAVEIHRVIEMAEERAALEADGHEITELHDYVVTSEQCGQIDAPADGWATETEAIPDSIWEGYR